jgi:hypothetical protein
VEGIKPSGVSHIANPERRRRLQPSAADGAHTPGAQLAAQNHGAGLVIETAGTGQNRDLCSPAGPSGRSVSVDMSAPRLLV